MSITIKPLKTTPSGITHYRISKDGREVGKGAIGKNRKGPGFLANVLSPSTRNQPILLRGSFKTKTAAKAAMKRFFR